MADSDSYSPRVWTWDAESGGKWSKINRPIAGATHDKELPVGKHPMQLYSLGTPNGVKVTVMLEELLALGHEGAEYDAHLIRIMDGDQFGSGFVDVNPNSKIPALLDKSTDPATRVFESGAILCISQRSLASSCRPTRASGVSVMVVLANGQRTLPRRWIWSFLRLRAVQDRILYRPFCHGDQASA